MQQIPQHRTGTAASGDVTIFYRRFGQPGKTPVLIVHGLSYFSYDWIGVASALAADREVVAIDMRGFGDSSRSATGAYGLRDLAGDLVAVLNHLGWPRAVLAGHSMGGRVCLCAGAWYPDRVAGLACVDFAPDVAAAGRRGVALRIGNQPDVFDSVDHALQYHGHDPALLPAGAPERLRYEAFLRPVDGKFELKRDLHFRDNFREVLRTGKQAPAGVDLWAMVRELHVPALFMRGRRSDMFAAETMDKLRQANPRCTVIELEGSHDLAGDNPDGVAQALRRFLGES